MAIKKYLVLRDTSEHKNKGWVFEQGEHCLGTEPKNLFTADYSIDGHYDNKTFVIERKGAVAEFVGNISQKEKWDDFKDELHRLEEFKHPFCICEFPLSLLKTFPVGSGIPKRIWPHLRITAQFLMKRLQEIDLKFKTKFVFCDTPSLGRDYASGLFKRIVESYD
jgi:hypothetical protein